MSVVSVLRNKLSLLVGRVGSLLHKKDRLISELRRMEQEGRRLSDELKRMNDEMTKLGGKEKQATAGQTVSLDKIRKIHEEKKKLEGNITKLEQQLKQLERELESYKRELKEKETQEKQLAQRAGTSDIEEINKKSTALEIKKERLLDRMKVFLSREKKLERDLAATESDLSASEREVGRMGGDLNLKGHRQAHGVVSNRLDLDRELREEEAEKNRLEILTRGGAQRATAFGANKPDANDPKVIQAKKDLLEVERRIKEINEKKISAEVAKRRGDVTNREVREVRKDIDALVQKAHSGTQDIHQIKQDAKKLEEDLQEIIDQAA